MNHTTLYDSLSLATKIMMDKIIYFFIFSLPLLGFSLLSGSKTQNFPTHLVIVIVLGASFVFLSCGVYGSLIDAIKDKKNSTSTFFAHGRKFFPSLLVYSLFLGFLFILIMLGLNFLNKLLVFIQLDKRSSITLASTSISILNIYVLPSLFYYNAAVGDAFSKGLSFFRKDIPTSLVLGLILFFSPGIHMLGIPVFVSRLVFAFVHLYVFLTAAGVIKKIASRKQEALLPVPGTKHE